MDAQTLQDRISKGMGVAARRAGCLVSIYRPQGVIEPISARNKIMELFALLTPGQGHSGATYGQALWQGVYDASYTQAGDFLVGAGVTYFVACQRPGLPVQCVLANRVVSIVRPLPATQGGYSGFFSTPGEPVLVGWPASLLEHGGHGTSEMAGQTRFGGWTLLLPALPVAPQIADVISDDLGSSYVVGSAEQSVLGWRLFVRQVGA